MKQEEEKNIPTEIVVKSSTLVRITEFDFFLSRKNIKKITPLFIYIFILGMIYIANAHYANKVIVNSAKIISSTKEMRNEYIMLKKEMMSNSRQTEVMRNLSGSGIKPPAEPAQKIFIQKNIYN